MIAIKDIKDGESLKEWLTNWPVENGLDEEAARAVAVRIVHRVAMRLLPLWWQWTLTRHVRKLDLTAVPILRCCFISGISGKMATPDLRRAASAAAAVYTRAIAAAARSYGTTTATAAAYTAYTATTTVYATTATATAYYASAIASATGHATATAFDNIRSDCEKISKGEEPLAMPLWLNGENPFEDVWHEVVRQAKNPEWAFWIKWYQDALDGRPQNWPMLQQIALIDPEVWDEGAEAVAEEVARIKDQYKSSQIAELFKATLYDFQFDALRHVMRAVPMPQDWETLTDPERLAAFLKDALDLREYMIVLRKAFSAEGMSMQGAGMTCIYLGQVLDELENAETVGALRVGKLVEWGRILESIALRDDTRQEFGPMIEPFGRAVDKLKDLIRNHFANTLARFSVLREIRMEEGDDPWQVLKDLRGIVENVRRGSGGNLPPLDSVDVVVLVDILDSIDRMIRQLDQSESEDTRSSLRREIDFQMAKVGATAGVYGEKARNALDKGGKASDEAIKWSKRGQGLWAMLRDIKEWLENSGGG